MNGPQRLAEGDELQLAWAGAPLHVVVGPSAGWADVRDVYTPDMTMRGVIAFKANGDWWWVRTFETFNDEDGG